LVLTRSAEFLDQQNRRGLRRLGRDSPQIAPPEIQAEFQQTIQLLEGLLRDAPENTDFLLALARCHRSVLPAAWAGADQQAAATAKQQAVGILERLTAQQPDDLMIQFELADTLAMTAQADLREPLLDSDVAVLERSLQLATDLHKKCPTALEYAILQANVHQRLGLHFLAIRQWSEAQDQLTRAAGVLEVVVASSPANPLLQTTLARVRWELADSLQRQGSLVTARDLLEKAIAQYDEFRNSEPGRRASIGLLVGLYRELARVQEQLGERLSASEASQTADRLRSLPR
jgi:tetratricopeptide (TPR) repeat protein